MYSIIKNVIDRGEYELSSIVTKVNTLWAEGSLTDQQREELVTAARNGASMQHSVDVLAKLEELDCRMKVLEADSASSTTAEPYVAGRWYYTGDVCTFDGKIYTCTAPAGVACVWSPADYPAYWAAG